MGPLHEAVAAQMSLLQAAAAAVKVLLLLPHGNRVKTAAAAAGPAAAVKTGASNSSVGEAVDCREQQLRGVLQQLRKHRHSSRELLVQLRQSIHHDMRQQQKKQQTQEPGESAEQQQPGAAASSAVDGWWLHAGAHYMQQLAFVYALDKVVAQMVAVAEAALHEGIEHV
jgi:hypothetical protein